MKKCSGRLKLREDSQWIGLQWSQRTQKKEEKPANCEFLLDLQTSASAASFFFRGPK